MFADTLTFTVNAVAKVLNRINGDNYSSEYYLRETDREFRAKLRNTSYSDKKRSGVGVHRHQVEFVETIYPVAPSTIPIVRKSYNTFENDATDSVVGPVKHTAALNVFLTEANLTKLVNFES